MFPEYAQNYYGPDEQADDMSTAEQWRTLIERMQDSATVKSVYGEPVELGEKTVIPVAKVRYGFGGGYGQDEEGQTEETTTEGGGVGGGLAASPAGVVEVTETETRFVAYDDHRKLLAVGICALVVGYVLGRRE